MATKLNLSVTPEIPPPPPKKESRTYTMQSPSSGKSYTVKIYEVTSTSGAPNVVDKTENIAEADWKRVAEKAVSIYESLKEDKKLVNDFDQLQLTGDLTDPSKTSIFTGIKSDAEKNSNLPSRNLARLDLQKDLDPSVRAKVLQTIKELAPIWSTIKILPLAQPQGSSSSSKSTSTPPPVVWNGKLPMSFRSQQRINDQKADLAEFFKGIAVTPGTMADAVANQLNAINNNTALTAQLVRENAAQYLESNIAHCKTEKPLNDIVNALTSFKGKKSAEKEANFRDKLLKGFAFDNKEPKDVVAALNKKSSSLNEDDKELLIRAYSHIIRTAAHDTLIPGLQKTIFESIKGQHQIVILASVGSANTYEVVGLNPAGQEINPSRCIFLHIKKEVIIGGLERKHIKADQVLVPANKDKAARDGINTSVEAPDRLKNGITLQYDAGATSLRCLDRSISDQLMQIGKIYPTTVQDRDNALDYEQIVTRETASNYILTHLDELTNDAKKFDEFVGTWTEAFRYDKNIKTYFSKEAFAALQGIIKQGKISDQAQKEWLLKAYAHYILIPNTMGDAGLLLAYSLAKGQQIAIIRDTMGIDGISAVYPDPEKPIEVDKCAFIYYVPGHFTSTNRVTKMDELKKLVEAHNKNNNKKLNEFLTEFPLKSTADVTLEMLYNGLDEDYKKNLKFKLYNVVQANKDTAQLKDLITAANTKAGIQLDDADYAGKILATPEGRQLVGECLRGNFILRHHFLRSDIA